VLMILIPAAFKKIFCSLFEQILQFSGLIFNGNLVVGCLMLFTTRLFKIVPSVKLKNNAQNNERTIFYKDAL